MRLGQKVILIVYALCFIFLSIFFVPYNYGEKVSNTSYGLLWSFGQINLKIWSMEIVTLSIVMAVIFICIGQDKKK